MNYHKFLHFSFLLLLQLHPLPASQNRHADLSDYGQFIDIEQYKIPTTSPCMQHRKNLFLATRLEKIEEERMILDRCSQKGVHIDSDEYLDLRTSLEMSLNVALSKNPDDKNKSWYKGFIESCYYGVEQHILCCLSARSACIAVENKMKVLLWSKNEDKFK